VRSVFQTKLFAAKQLLYVVRIYEPLVMPKSVLFYIRGPKYEQQWIEAHEPQCLEK